MSKLVPALPMVLLLPALAFGVTQRIVTVKASGGDYTSLEAAIAGEQKSLVALDRQLTIQCYASAAPDTAQVAIDVADGWVTDATHYIDIVVPPSERHVGKFDPTKYYRSLNNWDQGIEVIGVPYTRIEGVQFYVPPTTLYSAYAVQLGSESKNCLVDGILIDSWNAYSERHGIHLATAGGSTVRNTIIYGPYAAAIAIYWEPVTVDNVTIIGTGQYGNGSYGIDWSVNGGQGHLIRNVYCGGTTAACFNGPAASVTMITDASSDTTGTIWNVSVASAAFANINGPSIDANIQASSSLTGIGTNLSSAFVNDCAGRIHGAVWDIGACAAQSVGVISPNQKWVNALYQNLLGRFPSSTESQQILSQLSLGVSRSTIVQNLCATPEASAKITSMVQGLVLNIFYNTLLARSPTAPEVSFGDTQLHSPFITMLVTILESDEYFQRAQTLY
jgi:hypothetical protein